MKTTIEIADTLFDRAKRLAETRRVSFRHILQSALQAYLREGETKDRAPFRLRKKIFTGRGVQSGVREGDWARIRESIYEGCGD